ncbi:MAG: hypothetical protein RL088_2191 [Verrucomicrobiota bacterium]|jgi:hypothetical protein
MKSIKPPLLLLSVCGVFLFMEARDLFNPIDGTVRQCLILLILTGIIWNAWHCIKVWNCPLWVRLLNLLAMAVGAAILRHVYRFA